MTLYPAGTIGLRVPRGREYQLSLETVYIMAVRADVESGLREKAKKRKRKAVRR